jgi:hypothetical protein
MAVGGGKLSSPHAHFQIQFGFQFLSLTGLSSRPSVLPSVMNYES